MKSASQQKSIKYQVIVVIIAGVSLMTLLLGLLTVTGLNQQTRELMLSNAFQVTDGLAQQAIFPILSGSDQNALEPMKQVLGFKSVSAARLLLDNRQAFLSKGNFSSITDINAPSNSFNNLKANIIMETDDMWLISAPILLASEEVTDDESEFELEVEHPSSTVIGFAEIIYSKDSLQEIQTRAAITVTVVGFLSTFILSFILHFSLLRLFIPLNRLAQIMHHSKNTGVHLLAEVNGAKEVTDMANAYNSMMMVLDVKDEKLKQHRDRLEEDVAARTKELIVARDSAIQASKHKSEFIANMSHELRTPIQSIIGYGELVVEELELEGNMLLIEDMDKIARNSQRLLQMINSLLDLAKIESGHMALNNTLLDVNAFFIELSETMAPIANKSQNSFAIINDFGYSAIEVDKEKLEHVILNLLSNAFKFTVNGEIALIIKDSNEDIIIQVKDNGLGLSKEQQKYIFEEFRQVDSSQKRKFSGTGLGLTISRRFIDLMAGKLTVESTLGQGSTFTITLPLHK